MNLLNSFKYGTIALLVVTFVGMWTTIYAQDPQPPAGNAVARPKKITWDVLAKKLNLVVEVGVCPKPFNTNGDCKKDDAVLTGTVEYELDMVNAKMRCVDNCKNDNIDRTFEQNEAISVRQLLRLLEQYGVESHWWWVDGQGERQRIAKPRPNHTLPDVAFKFEPRPATFRFKRL